MAQTFLPYQAKAFSHGSTGRKFWKPCFGVTENGISIPEEAENFLIDIELNAKTGILITYDGEIIGLIGITVPLKREAAVVAGGLKKMGVHPARFKAKWAMKILFILYCLKRTNHQCQARNIDVKLLTKLVGGLIMWMFSE